MQDGPVLADSEGDAVQHYTTTSFDTGMASCELAVESPVDDLSWQVRGHRIVSHTARALPA
jgi:hypothetical protein